MNCPFCKSSHTETYYKATMPNILSACPKSMINNVEILPLEVKLCKDCLLGFNATKLTEQQLRVIYDHYFYIDPQKGIGNTRYSGMVDTLTTYFSSSDTLVEIGCLDGYLLKQLQENGFSNLMGIEPSQFADKAKTLGIPILQEYFDEHSLPDTLVDGFFLMHVFEHFDDPFSIITSMKNKLTPQGKIVLEIPDFGGYHHQHIFFYTIPFFEKLAQKNSLHLVDAIVEKGALRVVFVHSNNTQYTKLEVTQTTQDIVDRAHKEFLIFQEKIQEIEEILKANVGKKVVWWGAGSLSTIYLNQLSPELLRNVDFVITDGNNEKWGSIMPGLHQEIIPYTMLQDSNVDTVVIASIFVDEIRKSLEHNDIYAKTIHTLSTKNNYVTAS